MSLIDAARDLQPCVHCGLCLQSCPTYRVTGDEAESPRGRIVLMRGLMRGTVSPTDNVARNHLDTCLGCRACEPVCPSGVRYGAALEKVRAGLRQGDKESLRIRGLLAVMANRSVRRPALAVSRAIRSLLRSVPVPDRSMDLLLGTTPTPRSAEVKTPREARAQPRRRKRICLFTGCVMEGLFGHVHEATRRVLRANGYELVEVPEQECCGALHAHYGSAGEAQRLARANVAAFAASEDIPVLVNAAGCGAALKEYGRSGGEAERFSSRVFDLLEFLAGTEVRSGASLDLTVVYDPPCHLEHAQLVRKRPRKLIESIPGVRLIEAPDGDQCCGSAGIFALLQPEMSDAVLSPKVEALRSTGADVIATGNPGCIMQIAAGVRQAGLDTPVIHPIELLDWSYAAAGFYDGVM